MRREEIRKKAKGYFEQVDFPAASQLRDMLNKLGNQRPVRVPWQDDSDQFGESRMEILPTLARVIAFENASAREQQAELYQPLGAEPGEQKGEVV